MHGFAAIHGAFEVITLATNPWMIYQDNYFKMQRNSVTEHA